MSRFFYEAASHARKAIGFKRIRIIGRQKHAPHYKPKPAYDNVPNWQAYLEWYRQVVVEVLEIAAETGWRGPESPVKLEWERRNGRVI